MTVEWLIHLLQQQDPHAQVYIWTERADLYKDITEGHHPAISSIEEVKTCPGEKGVYIVEHDERNYF